MYDTTDPQLVHTAVVGSDIPENNPDVARREVERDEDLAHRLLKRSPVGGRNGPLGTDGPLGEGQPTLKVRKLVREGPLGREVAARRLIDTLRTSDAGDTQSRAVKVASGGGATAHPRSSGHMPAGVENAGGDTGDARA
jgi:hypothetical protein